jgi:hypothetical protein
LTALHAAPDVSPARGRTVDWIQCLVGPDREDPLLSAECLTLEEQDALHVRAGTFCGVAEVASFVEDAGYTLDRASCRKAAALLSDVLVARAHALGGLVEFFDGTHSAEATLAELDGGTDGPGAWTSLLVRGMFGRDADAGDREGALTVIDAAYGRIFAEDAPWSVLPEEEKTLLRVTSAVSLVMDFLADRGPVPVNSELLDAVGGALVERLVVVMAGAGHSVPTVQAQFGPSFARMTVRSMNQMFAAEELWTTWSDAVGVALRLDCPATAGLGDDFAAAFASMTLLALVKSCEFQEQYFDLGMFGEAIQDDLSRDLQSFITPLPEEEAAPVLELMHSVA